MSKSLDSQVVELWRGVGAKLAAPPKPETQNIGAVRREILRALRGGKSAPRAFNLTCPDCGAEVHSRRQATRVMLDAALAMWICRSCAESYGVENGDTL